MLYYLFEWLHKLNFPGAGMFGYTSFRALMAVILALLISSIWGDKFINLLKKKQITETQRDAKIDPFGVNKVGVPSMGGVIIITAILIPCLLLGKLHNIYMILMLITTVWLGSLGFADDYIKIFKKDKEGLHCAVRTALLLAGILGIICAAAGAVFSPWLLDIMSVPEEVRAGSLIYCRIYFGGIWAMILYNMMAGVLRAFGDSKKPLYVLVVCSVVNIVVDLILVGLMHTGVGGAAAATVLSQIVSVVLTAYFLVKSDFLEEKIGIRTMKICKEHMGMMVKKGFPLALQSMLFPIANSIVQASVNTMGTDSIAAWGICDKLDLLIWLIADSMVPVLTTYTAQNLGAGKTKRVKKGALIGTGLSVIAVGIISLVLYFGSGLIGPLFIDQKDVPTLIPLVVRYMQMMAPFFVFYAVAEALSGACCGLGETLVPMITTLLTICLFRVVCILLVLPSFKTMECIVWIYIGSWVVSGVAFAVLYLAKVRKLYHKKIK